MSPIRTFITRPIFTGMLMLVIVVFGLVAFPKIGVDQMPDVEFPVVTVTTVLPGADPESIESNVTKPLEEALNTLSGLDTLRSINVENVSQIVVRFDLERKVDVAAQDVRDKVQATLSKLPREIQTPVVQKFDIGAAPVVTLAFSAPVPIERLTKLAEDVVKPALQQLPGRRLHRPGGRPQARADHRGRSAVAQGYGLTPADVVEAVRGQSLDIPGGRTLEPGVERSVKLAAEARSVDELRALILACARGHAGADRRRGPGGRRAGRGPQLGLAQRPQRHRPGRPEAVRLQHRAGGRAGQGGPGRHPAPAAHGLQGRAGDRRRQVHPLLHRRRAGGPDPRRHPGGAGGAGLPAQLALHARVRGGAAHLHHRHLRGDAGAPLHLQHDHDAGADALHRPAHRRRHRGHREHRPPPGEGARSPSTRPATAPARSPWRCWR